MNIDSKTSVSLSDLMSQDPQTIPWNESIRGALNDGLQQIRDDVCYTPQQYEPVLRLLWQHCPLEDVVVNAVAIYNLLCTRALGTTPNPDQKQIGAALMALPDFIASFPPHVLHPQKEKHVSFVTASIASTPAQPGPRIHLQRHHLFFLANQVADHWYRLVELQLNTREYPISVAGGKEAHTLKQTLLQESSLRLEPFFSTSPCQQHPSECCYPLHLWILFEAWVLFLEYFDPTSPYSKHETASTRTLLWHTRFLFAAPEDKPKETRVQTLAHNVLRLMNQKWGAGIWPSYELRFMKSFLILHSDFATVRDLNHAAFDVSHTASIVYQPSMDEPNSQLDFQTRPEMNYLYEFERLTDMVCAFTPDQWASQIQKDSDVLFAYMRLFLNIVFVFTSKWPKPSEKRRQVRQRQINAMLKLMHWLFSIQGDASPQMLLLPVEVYLVLLRLCRLHSEDVLLQTDRPYLMQVQQVTSKVLEHTMRFVAPTAGQNIDALWLTGRVFDTLSALPSTCLDQILSPDDKSRWIDYLKTSAVPTMLGTQFAFLRHSLDQEGYRVPSVGKRGPGSRTTTLQDIALQTEYTPLTDFLAFPVSYSKYYPSHRDFGNACSDVLSSMGQSEHTRPIQPLFRALYEWMYKWFCVSPSTIDCRLFRQEFYQPSPPDRSAEQIDQESFAFLVELAHVVRVLSVCHPSVELDSMIWFLLDVLIRLLRLWWHETELGMVALDVFCSLFLKTCCYSIPQRALHPSFQNRFLRDKRGGTEFLIRCSQLEDNERQTQINDIDTPSGRQTNQQCVSTWIETLIESFIWLDSSLPLASKLYQKMEMVLKVQERRGMESVLLKTPSSPISGLASAPPPSWNSMVQAAMIRYVLCNHNWLDNLRHIPPAALPCLVALSVQSLASSASKTHVLVEDGRVEDCCNFQQVKQVAHRCIGLGVHVLKQIQEQDRQSDEMHLPGEYLEWMAIGEGISRGLYASAYEGGRESHTLSMYFTSTMSRLADRLPSAIGVASLERLRFYTSLVPAVTERDMYLCFNQSTAAASMDDTLRPVWEFYTRSGPVTLQESLKELKVFCDQSASSAAAPPSALMDRILLVLELEARLMILLPHRFFKPTQSSASLSILARHKTTVFEHPTLLQAVCRNVSQMLSRQGALFFVHMVHTSDELEFVWSLLMHTETVELQLPNEFVTMSCHWDRVALFLKSVLEFLEWERELSTYAQYSLVDIDNTNLTQPIFQDIRAMVTKTLDQPIRAFFHDILLQQLQFVDSVAAQQSALTSTYLIAYLHYLTVLCSTQRDPDTDNQLPLDQFVFTHVVSADHADRSGQVIDLVGTLRTIVQSLSFSLDSETFDKLYRTTIDSLCAFIRGGSLPQS